MLDFGFYNEDCLPRMKEYPDNFFDLAVVDPPYGDAGGGTDCRPSSQFTTEDGAGTPQKSRGGWNRFGQRFDRYKNPPLHLRTSEEGQELREQAALGQRNMQKNHCVGCRAGAGIF